MSAAKIEASVTAETARSAAGGIRVVSWNMEQQGSLHRGGNADSHMVALQTLGSLIGTEVSCVMAIVDAADKESWPQVRHGLALLQKAPFVAAAPLCVVANKEDAQGAEKAPVVADAVGVNDWKPACGKTFTASCSAAQSNGVKDALAIACALSLGRRQSTPFEQNGRGRRQTSQQSSIGNEEGPAEGMGHGASNLRQRRHVTGEDAVDRPEVKSDDKHETDEDDPYAEWLRDAAAKQEAKLAKGATAVQRSSPSQYFTALFCLFCALLIRTLIKRFSTDK